VRVGRWAQSVGARSPTHTHRSRSAPKYPHPALVKAAEIELPGWSVTGVLKNNCADYPLKFLSAYCQSRSGRIRKAGLNVFMRSTTRSGNRPMLAVAHKFDEGRTVTLLTTVGDCSRGDDYVQTFQEPWGEKKERPVERPTVAVAAAIRAVEIQEVLAARFRLPGGDCLCRNVSKLSSQRPA